MLIKYVEQKSQYAKTLIEDSIDPLIIINITGEIIDINEAIVTIIGIERKTIINSNFFNYSTEPQKVNKIFDDIFIRGSATNVPLILRHRTGILTNLLFNSSIFNDNKGNLLCAIIIIKNIIDKKAIDLSYLRKITKLDSKLIMEIISIYLQQTPALIDLIKKSLLKNDWETLHTAIHKLLPSLSAIGVSEDFIKVAKKIHAYSKAHENLNEIKGLSMQLENICTLICLELEEEYNILKNEIE